eukprot:7387838-Prymnesium_polylepis.1
MANVLSSPVACHCSIISATAAASLLSAAPSARTARRSASRSRSSSSPACCTQLPTGARQLLPSSGRPSRLRSVHM